MRICLVVSRMVPGGKERVVMHLAGRLAGAGAAVLVVCIGERGEFGLQLHESGVPVAELLSRKGADVRAIWRLGGLLESFAPDVINVHDRHSLPYVCLAARMSRRVPIVLTCHGLLMGSTSAGLAQRLAMCDVRAVTAVSAPAAQEYVRLLQWPMEVEVIPNGVPVAGADASLRAAARQALGLASDEFMFLAVGNAKPEKGFDDLIDAAAQVASGGNRFTVCIAGSADSEHGRALVARAAQLPDGPVRLLGPRTDTDSLYAAADAFVLSSRKEGLPMVLLEAMARRLPIVATRVGDVPTATGGGRCAVLCAPCNPAELAAGMAGVMADSRRAGEIAQAAYERARDCYSDVGMARRYMAVFERVCGAATETQKHNSSTTAPAAAGDSRGRDAHATRSGTTPPPKPSVVMTGPLPPPTGGMAAVVEGLGASSLRQTCDLAVLNNGKLTQAGRSVASGVLSQFMLAARLVGELLRTKRRGRALLHIHTCSGFTFFRDSIHGLLARLMRVPTVYHIHGGGFERFLRGLGGVRRGWARCALERAAAVIVLGSEWAVALRPFAPRARFAVIPNGVEVPQAVQPNGQAACNFLFLGNLGPKKGVLDLVAAAGMAAQAQAGISVSIAGGEGAAGQRMEVDRAIAALGQGGLVRLLGEVSGQTKADALRDAQCFVLPSYTEALPVSLLEAMACGLPVVATPVGSIPNVVRDGIEGLLTPPGDVPALARAMQKLAADPALRRRMGQAGRERVVAEYSLQVMVARIAALYGNVLGART